MLHSSTLYDAEAWKEIELPVYARELLGILGEKKTPADKLSTLNRALISAALPGVFGEDPSRWPLETVPHFRWVKDGKGGMKNHIVELPLPFSVMKDATELVFEVCPGNHAGYRVDMASIVLEQRENVDAPRIER